MYNAYGMNRAAQREMASDMWIQRHVPGGLNSRFLFFKWIFDGAKLTACSHLGPLGRQLDNYLGGNPNPTWGQMTGGYSAYQGYGNGYGYRRW